MIITSQTKIAALLKHHPDALEAIVALSPDFKKLRNPILRKIMAGRTTISMASKIGGCKPEDFFQVLQPLGFEADNLPIPEPALAEHPALPQFIRELKQENIVTLDVREMLAGGNDPLKLIQQTVKALAPDQVLKIVNSFEPTPLIKLLEKQGFKSVVDPIESDLTETYFFKGNNKDVGQLESSFEESTDWDAKLKQFEDRTLRIDVRHLEMPQPMMTILENLDTMPAEQALFVHHKRVPVFLLTELKDRKFDFRIRNISESEVHMLIYKD